MSRQYWVELYAWTTVDGTAIANTTTETIIFPNVTLPGNYMQDGRVLKLTGSGRLSTTGTPTITFAIRWGGVAGVLLATTEAITNGSGVSNVNWWIEALIQCRANGASGSLFVMGKAFVHTAAGVVAMNIFGSSGFDAPAAATVDLTTDKALSLTAAWGTANAANTLTGHNYVVESWN